MSVALPWFWLLMAQYRKPLGAVIVGASVVLSSVAIYQTTVGSGGGGGGDTPTQANLWVDTNGGSCTWSASPIDYPNNGTECDTMDEAYDSANSHAEASTVLIKAGSYAQQCLGGNRASGGDISFWTADGESVTVDGLAFDECTTAFSSNAVDHVNVTGPMTLTGGTNCAGTSGENCVDITVTNIDGTGLQIWNATDVIIRDSDWGPCVQNQASCLATQPAHGGNIVVEHTDGVQFINNTIHEMEQVSPGHFECFRGDDNANIVFRGNKWWRCEIYGINVGPNLGGTSYIENNWFGSTDSEGDSDIGSAVTVPSVPVGAELWIRFNSFQSAESIVSDSGTTRPRVFIIGNIVGEQGFLNDGNLICFTDSEYKYNIFNNAEYKCGDSTNTNPATFTDFYVNDSRTSSLDYHLTGANDTPDNFVPTSVTGGCPSTDIDGDSRPANTNCDAGSDERNQ